MSKIDITNYGPGRPPKPETVAAMKNMIRRIEREPGILNGKLARDLDMTALRCVQLARRLEKRGILKIERTHGGSLQFTLAA